MDPGFGGEVATYYARYRRGYPAAAVDAIVEALALTGDDLVVDHGGRASRYGVARFLMSCGCRRI